jgi:hypothetical protein
MGSAHFMTSATGYLAEEVMSEVREVEEEVGADWDENLVRREIAKECIYGVDVNGMAVELGKLSMWLETLAADRPLAFLDHHLKQGNSLVGSDITAVLSNGAEDADEGQLTLQQSFARVRERTLDHVMDLMRELLEVDNETLDDIKSMEELYDEIRSDALYQRLFELANVHTAEEFGVDVPSNAYETMAGAIENSDDWEELRKKTWFREAQEKARAESFFHWELEFPGVFFDVDGEKREDAGFDAVVGNPPYVRQEQISRQKELFSNSYTTYDSIADLYVYFIERGNELLKQGSHFGYITSNKFMRADYGGDIREYLTEKTAIQEIVDFGELPVFNDASTFPAIIIARNQENYGQLAQVTKIKSLKFSALKEVVNRESYTVTEEGLRNSGWSLAPTRVTQIQSKIEDASVALQEYIDGEIKWGVKTGLNEAFFLDEQQKDELISNNPKGEEHIEPLVVGDDIRQYNIRYQDRYLLKIPSGWTSKQSGYDDEDSAWEWFRNEYGSIAEHLSGYEGKARERYDQGDFWWELRPCDYYYIFESPKIIYPEIAMEPRFTIDYDGYYPNNKCYVIPRDDPYLLAILNSELMFESTKLRVSVLGDAESGGRLELRTTHIKDLPIKLPQSVGDELTKRIGNLVEVYAENEFNQEGLEMVEEDVSSSLGYLAKQQIELHEKYENYNLSLLDHLGVSEDDELAGPKLSDAGIAQPPAGVGDSPVSKTSESEEFHSLRVGRAEVKRESPTAVEIKLTARHKPDPDEKGKEAYTETEPLPALQITDLDEDEADLIESFVPVAVERAGGFAGFRETATKTNSLVDRLRALTLPDADAVSDGLESYRRTKERADELDEKIEKTDALIDEIVYDLYGLTDEEIEIVEKAVED